MAIVNALWRVYRVCVRAAGAVFLGFSVLVLAACSGGGGGGGGTSSAPTPTPPASGTVTISGAITFDSVPHNANNIGLNYNAITQKPARGVTVQAVNGAGTVLDSDVTNAAGTYNVTVDANINVRIRVRSELIRTGGPSWDVRVLNNTSGDALYVLAGSLTSSGAANSTRNLNAGSGWTGSSYGGTRAAGPFAILDAIYETLQDFAAVDGSINFPALQILWSVNNRSSGALNISAGDIGTSSYSLGFPGYAGVPTILILGDDGADTDEYDSHVVVHEFGHYFESQVARGDSIGGSHGSSDLLDFRVAFSEGWGNALSAMILDQFYRDSLGPAQSFGFAFDIESDVFANAGWYNEGSVQEILYDIFDSASDAGDTVSAGLDAIYEAMTSSAFTDEDSFATIYSFLDVVASEPGVTVAGLNALRAGQSFDGTGVLGTGETNTGGLASNLPVYKPITVGGGAVQVCSVDDNGDYNKLGNRAFLIVTVPAGPRTFTMTRTSGTASRDPDFRVWSKGLLFINAQSLPAETETASGNLAAGTYIIEAYDAQNTEDGGTRGDACYDFTVT